jgi:hypothetical protein
MNKQLRIGTGIIVLLLILISLQMSFAQTDSIGNIALIFDSEGSITKIQPYVQNDYYQLNNYYGVSIDNTGAVPPLFLQSDSETIYPRFIDSENILFKDVDFSKTYVLTIEGEEHQVYFCNNNNRCESCDNGDGVCTLLENSLTCPSDCSTGSEDSYCDLQFDGVCDPDCPEMDFDCDTCSGGACTYIGKTEPKSTCAGLDGTICGVLQRCDGTLTYTSDAGAFCCLGTCYDKDLALPTKQSPLKIVTDDTSNTNNPNDGSSNTVNPTSPEAVLEKTEKSFDVKIFLYSSLIVLFLLASVIAVVFFETQAIKKEHQVRNYVYDLLRQGYAVEQIRTSLIQQKVDASLITKILRQYRK